MPLNLSVFFFFCAEGGGAGVGSSGFVFWASGCYIGWRLGGGAVGDWRPGVVKLCCHATPEGSLVWDKADEVILVALDDIE